MIKISQDLKTTNHLLGQEWKELIEGTLIWACPNLIIGKVKTTKKCKTRFNLLDDVIDTNKNEKRSR